MRIEAPGELLRRLRLGREECFQRVLTCLILDGSYPRWNSRSTPGSRGSHFLRSLYSHSFDDQWPGDGFRFVDELELPPRHDAEKGGAPDWAVIWPDRVWLIELKTERGSHRPAQVPGYFELAHHHFPRHQVDLTYLTGPMPSHAFRPEPPDRYAHVQWREIADLIDDAWADASEPAVVELLAGIEDLGLAPGEWRAKITGTGLEPKTPATPAVPSAELRAEAAALDAVEEGKQLASATAEDGQQRAVASAASSLEELQSWRLELRTWIVESPQGGKLRHVMPWIWGADTSGGQPLTAAGQVSGYELRLSRYRSPLY